MKEKILSLLEKIPALSPTISKIVELTKNQNSSASNLIQAIKFDPVLTIRILKVINSAYYGMDQQVTSLNRAIVLLGMNTIKNLALSAEVLSSFNPKGGKLFSVEKFWEHSLACAVASKILIQKITPDKKKHEDLFIAGLIHDIGKIFLIKYFVKEYFLIMNETTDSAKLLAAEKEMFTLDHAEVGALVAAKWALPEDMVSSVKYHHDIELFEGDSMMPLIVHMANNYTTSNGFSSTDVVAASAASISKNSWDKIGMKEEEGMKNLSHLPEKVEEARVFIKT
jgi:putative nucleotidyltransferase with HDIG domain